MRVFQTIQAFINYMPHCIVCGKAMELFIYGTIPNRDGTPYFNRTNISHKMIISENIATSKNRKHLLIIDLNNNKIIEGGIHIKDMLYIGMSADLKCWTCDFRVHSYLKAEYFLSKNFGYNSQSIEYFPQTELYNEEIHYTLSTTKKVSVFINYGLDGINNTTISVNRKYLDKIQFVDLSKIKNLKHLSNKIKTLITFQ